MMLVVAFLQFRFIAYQHGRQRRSRSWCSVQYGSAFAFIRELPVVVHSRALSSELSTAQASTAVQFCFYFFRCRWRPSSGWWWRRCWIRMGLRGRGTRRKGGAAAAFTCTCTCFTCQRRTLACFLKCSWRRLSNTNLPRQLTWQTLLAASTRGGGGRSFRVLHGEARPNAVSLGHLIGKLYSRCNVKRTLCFEALILLAWFVCLASSRARPALDSSW